MQLVLCQASHTFIYLLYMQGSILCVSNDGGLELPFQAHMGSCFTCNLCFHPFIAQRSQSVAGRPDALIPVQPE